jgi:hypothetical protein
MGVVGELSLIAGATLLLTDPDRRDTVSECRHDLTSVSGTPYTLLLATTRPGFWPVTLNNKKRGSKRSAVFVGV